MLKDGRYIISNCAVTGVKMFQDQLFVSVPRWLPGGKFKIDHHQFYIKIIQI